MIANKKILYTKKALNCFRIISISCSLLLIVVEIWSLFDGILVDIRLGEAVNYYGILGHCFNFLSIIIFIFTFFFPQKFGLISVVAFIYAFFIIPFEPQNYMGIMMFFLGTTVLFARGLMKNHMKTKLMLLSFLFLCLILSTIRFSFDIFLSLVIEIFGCILVLLLIVFFLRAYCLNNLIYEDKRLNIACYPELEERDCEILKKIQKNEKYWVIANEVGFSLGGFKNHMHEVFDIMEVGDKQGFLSYYSDWNLYFNPETARTDLIQMKERKNFL